MSDPAFSALTRLSPWLVHVRPREGAPSCPPSGSCGFRWVRRVRRILLAALTLYALAFAARAYIRKYSVFLPDYARWTLGGAAPASWLRAERPTHVFILIADHFEPDWNSAWVDEWTGRYARLASRHHDSAGRPPQHTWFYPGEQVTDAILSSLQRMTLSGLGEVELHYHHGYDTTDSARDKYREAIDAFQRFGFLKTVKGETKFAFVHGNSGLDNSNGPEMCGVNDEIRLLRDMGCFADFTFPSLFEDSQPGIVNSIYAARDDDGPKSYQRRLPLATLGTGESDLMIFEGPLIFSPSLNIRHLFLDLDDGDIHAMEHATPGRADRWVRANVHVPERPDWVFVKLFAHGASSAADAEACLGADFDSTLSHLEHAYNDGSRYVLHYITAREAYNLARAAAEGARGEPAAYLDAYVGRYLANAAVRSATAD
jgi:hypothetical protein